MLANFFGAGRELANGTCVEEEGAHGAYSFCWCERMRAGRGWRPGVAGRVTAILF